MESGAPSALLPPHPPLIQRDAAGPRTIFVSPTCPRAMQRAEPWSIADYMLTKQLYRGKASTLYLGHCRHAMQTVVIKAYSKRRLSPLNWYQVDREIRLHRALEHENIIALYGAFEDKDHVYLVQEHAMGGDLYEDLKHAGGQYKEQAVARDILPPFLSALHYLHSKRIIHRDIKPENILLTSERVVKMADFGLSICWAEERPVTRAGTLDYMSPEVLRCPEKSLPEENKEKVLLGYTEAVDAWAVGVLAYELLVGRPPFEKESRDETYALIMHQEPAFPPWMSEGAKGFISAALVKTARKRPGVLDLLRHPWLQMHMRRPSVPARVVPGLDMEVLETVPLGLEQHRPSMHGANTARALALGGLQEEAGSGATGRSSPVPAATVRPATPPAAAALPAVAAVPAAASAKAAGTAGPAAGVGDQQQRSRPTTPKLLQQQQHAAPPALSVHILPEVAAAAPATVAAAAAKAAVPQDYQGSFMDLYKSMAPAAPPEPANTSPRIKASSGSSSSKGAGEATTLPPLGAPRTQRTSSFRRVISQPALHTDPLPALAPAAGVHGEASRGSAASGSAATSPRSPGAAGEGASGPAVGSPAAGASAAPAVALPTIPELPASTYEPGAAPVPTAPAAATATEAAAAPAEAAAAVAAIPASLAAGPAPGPPPQQQRQQQQGAHSGPSAKAPPKLARASPQLASVAAGSGSRPASPARVAPELGRASPHLAPAAATGSGLRPASPAKLGRASPSLAGAAPGGGSRPGSAARTLPAAEHSTDSTVDRMREAERKHIEKLERQRGRKAGSGAVHPIDLHADARLRSPAGSALPSPTKHQQQGAGASGGAGSSIARTAESLLAKLLGKRGAGGAAAGPKARPQTAAVRKSPASATAAAGLARSKSNASALLGKTRSAAPPSGPPSPTKASLARSAAGSLPPSAQARHAALAALDAYRVTDKGILRTKSSPTAALLGSRGLQSSGGSLTHKASGGSATRASAAKPPAGGEGAAAAGAAAAAAAAAAGSGGSPAGEEAAAVEEAGTPREESQPADAKHVQFSEGWAAKEKLGVEKSAAPQAAEGDGDGADQELIRAHRGPAAEGSGAAASSATESFATALSSPAPSLPSLTRLKTGGLSGTVARSARSGGSPASHGSGSFGGLGSSRVGGGRKPSSLSATSPSVAAAAGSHRHRLGGRTASTPGDTSAGAGGEGGEGEEGDDTVQRSAASWSPPHGAAARKASPSAAHGPRLQMYIAMGGKMPKRGGA